MPGLQHSTFRGVHELLTNESERPHQEDIDDDLEGEKETLAELTSDEVTTERMKRQWRESVGEASKGVTEKTNDGYQRFFFVSFDWLQKHPSLLIYRLGKQCVAFLIKNKLITKAEEFLCPNPPSDADMYIIAWIMNE